MKLRFKILTSILIFLSVSIILTFTLICILLFKPQLIIEDIQGYINNKLSSSFNGKFEIQNIEGDFINGFTLGPVNYIDEKTIIFSMQEIFVDPDISRIIFGTLSLSEVIISNSYLNLDKFRLLRTELSNKNAIFPIDYHISALKIKKILLLSNNKKYIFSGEMDFIYDTNYNFNINRLNIKSTDWFNELTINSGKIQISNDELSIINLESRTDSVSFKLSQAKINLTELNKSTGNLIINQYHYKINDSSNIVLKEIKLNIQNLHSDIYTSLRGNVQYNNKYFSDIIIEGYLKNNFINFKNASFVFNKQKININGSFNLKNNNWGISSSLNNFKMFNNVALSGEYNIKGTNIKDYIFGNVDFKEVYIDSIYFGAIKGEYEYRENILKSNNIIISSESFNGSLSANSFINKDNYDIYGTINFTNFKGISYLEKYNIDSLYGTTNFEITKEANLTNIYIKTKFDNGILLSNGFERIDAVLNGKITNNKYDGILKGVISNWLYGPYDWENVNYMIKYSDIDSSLCSIRALSSAGDKIKLFAKKALNDDFIEVNLSGLLKQEKLYIPPFYINSKNDYLQIPEINIFIGEALSNLSFNYRNSNNFEINGNLSNINLSKLYSIIGRSLRIKGNIEYADFKIEKNINTLNSYPIILLNASFNSGSVDDVNFTHMIISSSYRNNRLLLSDLQLYTDLGNITVNGWINIDIFNNTNKFINNHKLDLSFSYENIDLLKFNRYLPWTMEARGYISGLAKIGGTVSNPSIYSEMKIISPGFDKFNGIELNGKLYHANHRMDFTNLSLLTKYGSYTGNGHMPMNLTFMENNKISIKNNPIDFMFIGKTNNIEFLPSYFDAIDSLTTSDKLNTDFTYTLQLLITGSISKPVRDGMLIIRNGSLYIDAINEPIKDIVGNISITNNQLIIEKLLGTLYTARDTSIIDNLTRYIFSKSETNKSNINVYGSVNLTELLNPDYALTIKGNNISFSSSYDLFNGMVDANIDVTGKDTVLISGELIPSPYDFTITSLGYTDNYQSGKLYTRRKIAYDIHTPIKEAIRIKTDNLDFLIEGDLSITKADDDDFNISGKADIIEGNFYDNQGNIYQNTFGTIELSPIDNAPFIDLNAQTEIDGNLIDIAFVGYTDNPTLIINSPNHNYTQTEILQILTFGNTGEDIVDSEKASNLLTNFIENEIEKNISQYTPLDEFQLTSNSSILNTIERADNIDLKLVLGKQFTKKIYVNTELDINDFQNSKYQATYRLNKKTSIVGGIDVENKWHFRYRYKFYY